MPYKYVLEPYSGVKTRFSCPACGNKEKSFSRYIDSKTRVYLSPLVGRCNRELKCGYHLTPKQFFKQKDSFKNLDCRKTLPLSAETNTKLPNYISKFIFKRSLNYKPRNNLISYLRGLFGSTLTNYLAKTYFIGTAKYWNGATVFWQVDRLFNIRTGKVILYDPNTGKRIKKPFNHITWVHKLLKLKNYNLDQCLFGEHLLRKEYNKPIALVESEKTAIVASVYMPEFVWLACGGINDLTTRKIKVLAGKKVLLFPDLNGTKKWLQKASEIEQQVSCQILVSEMLENNASEEEKRNGLDIADYLIKRDDKFGWALSPHGYPLFWDW